MNKKELAEKLRNLEFRFAKTYAHTYPHEYIVQEQQPEIFTEMKKLIEDEGYEDHFKGYKNLYLKLDGYKYWIIGNILNREPLTGYTLAQIDQALKS